MAKPKQQRWTSAEDGQLIALADAGLSAYWIAKALGRSVYSVKCRRWRIRYRISRAYEKAPWTEPEDDYLRKHYGDYSAPQIARVLNRSKIAVRTRAAKLGLKAGKIVAHNVKPIGSKYVTPDGYEQTKIALNGNPTDWQFSHLLLWEKENGPVPAGYRVTFKDGNRRNIKLENLELKTQRQIFMENHINSIPEELRPLVILRNKVKKELKSHDQNE